MLRSFFFPLSLDLYEYSMDLVKLYQHGSHHIHLGGHDSLTDVLFMIVILTEKLLLLYLCPNDKFWWSSEVDKREWLEKGEKSKSSGDETRKREKESEKWKEDSISEERKEKKQVNLYANESDIRRALILKQPTIVLMYKEDKRRWWMENCI